METPVYEESQTMPTWFLLLIGLVLLAALASALLSAPEEQLGLVLVVLFVLAVMLFLFYRMRVAVTTSELQFGFTIWRKRLPLQDIQVLGTEPIPWYAGLGIHFYGGKWIYSARFKGQGVHLVYQGKKDYLIGSNHPDALLSALTAAKGR
jgi:hypothetical protein